MTDLIDRKMAIDALGERLRLWTGCDYELGCANQYDLDRLAIETVPSAQPEQRWIPVSEGLPKEYGEYICTMENGQVQECGFVPENQRGLVDGWSTCEADGHKFLGYADVLAWMPRPKPYKGDDTE